MVDPPHENPKNRTPAQAYPFDELQKAAQQEIAPRRIRRYRAFLFQGYLIFAVVAFIVLAILASTSAYFPIDLTITRMLQANNQPWVALLMEWISWPGFFPQSAILTVLVAALVFFFGFHWEAVVSLAAASASLALNTAVKLIVHRPRPAADLVHVVDELNSFSYPSGHVMYYTVFFGFLCFLIYTLLKPSWRRSTLLFFSASLPILIAPSRIFLGEHWASDVLGGYLLGSICLLITIFFYRWGRGRLFRAPLVVSDEVANAELPEDGSPPPGTS